MTVSFKINKLPFVLPWVFVLSGFSLTSSSETSLPPTFWPSKSTKNTSSFLLIPFSDVISLLILTNFSLSKKWSAKKSSKSLKYFPDKRLSILKIGFCANALFSTSDIVLFLGANIFKIAII